VEDLDAAVTPAGALRAAAAAGWAQAGAETLVVGVCPDCARAA
jgi:hypothetical protein